MTLDQLRGRGAVVWAGRGVVGHHERLSGYGRRQLRLSDGLSRSLWALRKEAKTADDDLVFSAANRARIDASNLMTRV